MTGSPVTRQQQRQGELALLVLTMIWGTSFIVTRLALSGIGPFTLLAMRFTIGFFTLFILFFRRMLRITRTDIKAGVVLGTMFLIGNAFQTTGLQYTSAGVSGFITALSVVIVPVLGLFILRQRPTRGAVIGIILATVGLALLSLNEDLRLGYGDLLTLGCAVAFAFHVVYVAKYAAHTEPTAMVAVQLGLAAVASIAVAGATEVLGPLPGDVLPAALYLGLLPTAFCFVVQVYGQRTTSATRAALIYAAEPVFAAFFAYLVAGEVLSERGLVGCGLILAGMLAAELW